MEEQLPVKGDTYLKGEKVILKTDGKETVPNMKGWSLRDVLKVVDLNKLKLESSGSGYVSSQSIKAGSKVKENDKVSVKLKEPE